MNNDEPAHASQATGEIPNMPKFSPELGDQWDAFLEDVQATADEYRKAGWDVTTLHPGDVTAVVEDVGAVLDVLIPDNELDELTPLATGGNFDSYDVYQAVTAGHMFLLLAEKDTEQQQMVLAPIYYQLDSASEAITKADENNEIYVRFRPLSGEPAVELVHEDPDFLVSEV